MRLQCPFDRPPVIAPGLTGTIRVEGVPPGAGERNVAIEVACNVEPARLLSLRLTMIGARRPPYVTGHSHALRFGQLRTGQADVSESFWVETREPAEGLPWLDEMMSTIPGLTVQGGVVAERDLGGGVLFRRYLYDTTLEEATGVGKLSGEIYSECMEGQAPSVSIPVHAVIRPHIYPVPTSLLANQGSENDSLRLRLSLIASDPGYELVATPEVDPECVSDIVTLDQEDVSVLNYEVVLSRPPHDFTDTVIRFVTNHDEMDVIEVPLRIVAGSAD